MGVTNVRTTYRCRPNGGSIANTDFAKEYFIVYISVLGVQSWLVFHSQIDSRFFFCQPHTHTHDPSTQFMFCITATLALDVDDVENLCVFACALCSASVSMTPQLKCLPSFQPKFVWHFSIRFDFRIIKSPVDQQLRLLFRFALTTNQLFNSNGI